MTNEQLIDEIKQKSVLDLADLVKSLEEVFGVSASAAPMMMAGPAVAVPPWPRSPRSRRRSTSS
jgi:large subunit ribosomal protein L7/L12